VLASSLVVLGRLEGRGALGPPGTMHPAGHFVGGGAPGQVWTCSLWHRTRSRLGRWMEDIVRRLPRPGGGPRPLNPLNGQTGMVAECSMQVRERERLLIAWTHPTLIHKSAVIGEILGV